MTYYRLHGYERKAIEIDRTASPLAGRTEREALFCVVRMDKDGCTISDNGTGHSPEFIAYLR
ncbi:hypothetical protein GCM10027290_65890 [Micromonospora sonneratiae]